LKPRYSGRSKPLGFGEKLKFFLIRMLGSLFLLALGGTWRLRFRGLAFEKAVREKGLRPIYAFWHGRLLALAYSHRDRKVQIMISEHGDGEMIAQVTSQLGFGSVRGSTTRGGLRAMRALARRLLDGFDVAITPDGPRGPRHVLQAGAIYIAMRTGHPLVPITSSGWPRWTFGSGDRFIRPKPFANVLVRLGMPFHVPPDLDEKEREEYRRKFEKQMIDLVDTADREVAGPGR
jgi:lysophospholipid acyltransferase (LPLAT)-like uncharacterized protein